MVPEASVGILTAILVVLVLVGFAVLFSIAIARVWLGSSTSPGEPPRLAARSEVRFGQERGHDIHRPSPLDCRQTFRVQRELSR